MKLKGKSQAKCKQFGGLNNNKVIVETGEYFRNSQGDIRRATNAPSHDDEELGEVVDAQSVISASYDQVQKGTRKSSAKERKFAIKSSRQKELMYEVGLEYYKPSKGRLSPSAFVERAAEQTGKIISKYKIDPENYSKYSKNTQQANDALIADLPTMNELYDLALTDQEYKRNEKENFVMQYGGNNLKEVDIKGKRQPIIVDNPNDPRLKAYQDSLSLHTNAFNNVKKQNKEMREYIGKDIPFDGTVNSFSKDSWDMGSLMKYAGVLGHKKIKPVGWYSDGLSDKAYPAYKKPTQPVVFQQGKTKLPDVQIIEQQSDGLKLPEIEPHIAPNRPVIRKPTDGHTYYQNPGETNEDYRSRLNRKGYTNYQYGGEIPTSLNGVHDVGKNPVIVPSNNISMENVDFQIDAFDNNTGEYLTRMNPEENYQFNNVESVREIPVKAQYGGAYQNENLDKKQTQKRIQELWELEKIETNPERKAMYNRLVNNYVESYTKRNGVNPQKSLDELYEGLSYSGSNNSSKNVEPETVKYSGVPWNPLERNQKLPIIKGQTQPINGNVIQYSGNNTSQPVTSQYSGNNIPEVVPNKSVRNNAFGRKDWDYGNYRTNNLKDGIYTVDKGDWLSSIAASNGLKTEDLIKANPQLKNPNKLNIGDKINIPTNVSTERTQFNTIPNKTIDDTQAGMLYNGEITWDGITPHMKAPEVGAYIPPKDIENEIDINADVPIGRINRDMSLNAMRQIMLNNRSVDLPYRTEVPNRTYKYNEIDATPQLNRIAASTNQQLQNVNMNTSQGQAVANAIAARNLGVENQTLNQIGQQNRQIRTQTDNMNVQALNNFDLLQEQANANYTNEVYQTLAARDQAKVQQADLLDQAIRERRNTDNAFTMMNIANPNFKIDPRTGEVVRIKKSFKEGQKEKKARWGFTKRLS